MYMMDTNIFIDILRRPASAALKRIQQLPPSEVAISAITLAELEHGVNKSSNPAHNARLLIAACSMLTILPFDNNAAAAYGVIRAQLERQGKPIGPMDMLIAAHALSLDATLATNNMREFKRIKGLKLENWLRG